MLDTSGARVAVGKAVPVAGTTSTVTIKLPPLSAGVYTVNWRTVSAVDGHVGSGVFAFAVGRQSVPPVPIAPAAAAPPPSFLGVTGRWGLDAGYGLLLGGAWVDLLAFTEISLSLLLLVGIGEIVALIGAAMMVEAARENAGVGWAAFVGTNVAHGLEWIIVPLLGAGIAVIAAWQLGGQARRVALATCALCSVLAMLGNAIVSHAVSSTFPVLMIVTHWLHILTYAVWIGGLAAVLVGIRGLPTVDKARAVARFSLVAGGAFALVILTGTIRSIDEVGSWSNLFFTTFGWLILAKTALFFAITPLAAVNRWRNVRMGVAGIRPLRWISREEVALAAVITVLAAFLTALPPPSFVRSASASTTYPHETIGGVDQGNAVRALLEVAPGHPGVNRFTATLREVAGGRPVGAQHVYLLFDLAAHPEFGESILELRDVGNGIYTAVSPRLSVSGAWTVTVVIETARTTYDVVFMVAPTPTALP